MLRPRGRTRKILWLLAIAVVVVVGAAAIAPVRHALLRGVGQMLIASDSVESADLMAMDVESGAAGVLTLSDLYRANPTSTVALLRKAPTSLDAELARRGVTPPDYAYNVLRPLGVPASAILRITLADDEGTTEPTAALAAWARAHPGSGSSSWLGRHTAGASAARSGAPGRPRCRRRRWSRPRCGNFRSDNWWQSRATLREGLVEIEKLALDYVTHPF